MEYIPNEILTMIFSLLGGKTLFLIRRVCKNWKEIIDDCFGGPKFCKNLGCPNNLVGMELLLPYFQNRARIKLGKEQWHLVTLPDLNLQESVICTSKRSCFLLIRPKKIKENYCVIFISNNAIPRLIIETHHNVAYLQHGFTSQGDLITLSYIDSQYLQLNKYSGIVSPQNFTIKIITDKLRTSKCCFEIANENVLIFFFPSNGEKHLVCIDEKDWGNLHVVKPTLLTNANGDIYEVGWFKNSIVVCSFSASDNEFYIHEINEKKSLSLIKTINPLQIKNMCKLSSLNVKHLFAYHDESCYVVYYNTEDISLKKPTTLYFFHVGTSTYFTKSLIVHKVDNYQNLGYIWVGHSKIFYSTNFEQTEYLFYENDLCKCVILSGEFDIISNKDIAQNKISYQVVKKVNKEIEKYSMNIEHPADEFFKMSPWLYGLITFDNINLNVYCLHKPDFMD